MKKYVQFVIAIAFAVVTTYNASTYTKTSKYSALILDNIEALANDEFCKDCQPCTGDYTVCANELDGFFDDMMTNCSSFDGILNIEDC